MFSNKRMKNISHETKVEDEIVVGERWQKWTMEANEKDKWQRRIVEANNRDKRRRQKTKENGGWEQQRIKCRVDNKRNLDQNI